MLQKKKTHCGLEDDRDKKDPYFDGDYLYITCFSNRKPLAPLIRPWKAGRDNGYYSKHAK
jgi:hypothetical protein